MKRYISAVFPVFLLIFTLLFRGESKEVSLLTETNMEKAYENVLASAVRVQGRNHHGSGSIFEIKKDQIIIVTNKHVIQYFDDDSYVTFFNGMECHGRILGYSETADVGFISIPSKKLDKEKKAQLRAVCKREKAYDDLKENDCFFMIDMAGDPANPSLYKGTVVDKARYLIDYEMEMLYGDGMAVPGMSGSGIFDYYGNYIAILSGATEQYELAGVPLKVIMEEYGKIED